MHTRQLKCLALLLMSFTTTACGQQALTTPIVEPTEFNTEIPMPSPTITVTSTSPPTSSPTYTPTSSPTYTPTPLPVTATSTIYPEIVTGIVRLISDQEKPFATFVELHRPGTFDLVKSGKADSNGAFSFDGIPSGKYEVWALLNYQPVIIEGCGDVIPKDKMWRIGIKFGEEKAMTWEDASMEKAILLIKEVESSGLVATGIYAVSDVEVGSEVGGYVEMLLICR
jgi:hypothetical protein